MPGVRVVFCKWGGRPHWEFDALRLGRDEHGTWLGAPPGTRLTRPGADFRSEQGFVTLLPDDAGFVATFYADGPTALPEGPEKVVEVYVDITTVPEWRDGPGGTGGSGGSVRMVDLDLDVVRGRTGRVWVDDEDEFADHRSRFGYPDEVVRLATSTCAEVHAALVARRAPYDGVVSAAWLSRLTAHRTSGATGSGC